MNGSVWNEEVCSAFLAELRRHVRIKSRTDRKTLIVPPGETAFFVRKPEEEFKAERLPCVSIYIKDTEHDPLRHYPFKVPVRRSETDPNSVFMEYPAVTFNMTVQIDFWSRYQEDMDTMTRTWLLRHYQNFNLPAVDDAGNPRDLNVYAQGSLVVSDLMRGKETLYHRILNYVTWVDIDANETYNEGIVQEVLIETTDMTVRKE